ncbi:MAG: DUF3078 domain-containing protein, partial [Fibrobacterota bacterium]
SLNLSQSYYSDNWDGNELGAISWIIDIIADADADLNDLLRNENTLKLAFGQSRFQNDDDSWQKFRKSTDNIEYESILLFDIEKYLEPYAAVKARSQFLDEAAPVEEDAELVDPQYDLHINPLEVTESFGLSRRIISEENSSLTGRFGGGFKQLYERLSLQDDGTYDDVLTNDAGLELAAKYDGSFRGDMIDYRSEFFLYAALASSSDEGDEDWKYPDLTWDNTVNFNINSFLHVRFTMQMLYDRNIDSDLRFTENLSVGINFKRSNQ